MTNTLGTAMLVLIACVGCSHSGPAAPARSGYATLSGSVYRSETPTAGEPLLVDVLVEVTNADGSIDRVQTATDGSYEIVLRVGSVTVTVSKAGYEGKRSHFVLERDIVLNFSLTPI